MRELIIHRVQCLRAFVLWLKLVNVANLRKIQASLFQSLLSKLSQFEWSKNNRVQAFVTTEILLKM
jgi:hypothetical protein